MNRFVRAGARTVFVRRLEFRSVSWLDRRSVSWLDRRLVAWVGRGDAVGTAVSHVRNYTGHVAVANSDINSRALLCLQVQLEGGQREHVPERPRDEGVFLGGGSLPPGALAL